MSAGTMSRSAWTSAPAAAPGQLVPAQVRGVAVHHNGPAVPARAYAGDPDAVRRYLEAVRRQHVVVNGWSDIAYSWAVDATGRLWELRGWQLRTAANGSWELNSRYGAVLAILGDGQAPTPGHVAGIRAAVASFRRVYPNARRIVGHRDLFSTACPGAELYALLRAGQLEPDRPPAPKPPAPPQEDDPLAGITAEQIGAAVAAALVSAPVGVGATDGPGTLATALYRTQSELMRVSDQLANLGELLAASHKDDDAGVQAALDRIRARDWQHPGETAPLG